MIEYYFHGGLLPSVWDLHRYPTKDRYDKSKTDAGYGLYVVDHWETARRYQKGNRRLYVVGVEMDSGKDISDVYINRLDCTMFLFDYFGKGRFKYLNGRLDDITKDGYVRAEYFDNMLINSGYMSGRIGKELICFLVNNGVGYRKVFNRFGYGENMLVVYDVRCIRSIQVLRGKDMVYSIDEYKDRRGK